MVTCYASHTKFLTGSVEISTADLLDTGRKPATQTCPKLALPRPSMAQIHLTADIQVSVILDHQDSSQKLAEWGVRALPDEIGSFCHWRAPFLYR